MVANVILKTSITFTFLLIVGVWFDWELGGKRDYNLKQHTEESFKKELAASQGTQTDFEENVVKKYCDGDFSDGFDCVKRFNEDGFVKKLDKLEYKEVIELQNDYSKKTQDLGLL